MRLIDADALKKCAIPCEIHNGALTDLCVTVYQIDNAPTVDKGYNEGHIDGMLKAEKLYARPLGEWVEELTLDRWVQELPSVYYCSRCRSEPFGDNLYHYCPNCGAKMRGAEE